MTFVDDPTPEEVGASIRDNTKAVYLETIGSPKGDVPDLGADFDEALKASQK